MVAWLDLVPRWMLLAILAVAVAASVACRVALASTHLQLAQLQAAIATERAQAADAGRLATERFRAQEARTAAAGQEITHDTMQSTAAASSAARAAAVAGDGLRIRAATVAASCSGTASDTSIAGDGQATAASCAVLADVLGRLESAGRELAAAADARGIAGTDCQRRYEALNAPAPN